MKKTIFLGFAYSSIILNVVLIVIFFIPKLHSEPKINNSTQFPFISKRVLIENNNDVIINFVNLRTTLASYVNDDQNIGVYFEYLPSGVSIGINDRNNFVIASLLKVPMAMGVFKQIEQGRIKEDDVLTIEKKDLDPGFGTLWNKGAGTKITVRQALDLALQESDNTASNVLLHNIASGLLSEVFDYLDIPKDLNSTDPVVTPKNYSSIIRSLYLASYLSPKYSNELLGIMTGSKYNDRLAAPIPKDVKVAHKIGVHETSNSKISIYTDCGIVYVPKRPYVLCIMTKEETEDQAIKIMRDISSLVYNYVETVNKNKK